MSARSKILQRLIASPNAAVERAVEFALPEATPAEQIELADVLLERNRRAGWVALIRTFHRLDESIREKILARPRDLFGPLAETMQDSDGPARENVIAIVDRCADVHLVYLLAESLMDARVEVRTLAGNSLLEAVRRNWRATHPTLSAGTSAAAATMKPAEAAAYATSPEASHQLHRAVEIGVRLFKTHRQNSALLAALIHERQQDGPMWATFQDPYDDRTRAATIILRAPTEPPLAAAVFLALGSSLKPAAMAGLAAIESPAIAAAIAAESYRLIDPVLRDPAQNINHLKLLPALRKEPPWTLATWGAWLRLIENVGLQPAERLNWLTRMLEAAPAGPESCAWKVCVSRAIAETELAEAFVPLAALVRDANERVARYAARLILGRNRPEWRERAAIVLPTSPHASVQMLSSTHRPRDAETPAAPATGSRGFNKAWNDFQRMPPAVQHTTARTVAADPALADHLRTKFNGAPQDVAQALRMIAALPNLAPYRSQIISLCGHADPRIASMAVRLVGRLEDPRLKELLEAAAQHADPRVRANAIESMENLHIADRSQQVLTMLNSRNNRERASAIKALGQFNFANARECLNRMLSDTNPLHRMSALWVVGQLDLLEVMRQVSSIARKDPNLRVRRRAAEMLETLSGNISGPS